MCVVVCDKGEGGGEREKGGCRTTAAAGRSRGRIFCLVIVIYCANMIVVFFFLGYSRIRDVGVNNTLLSWSQHPLLMDGSLSATRA